MRSWIDIISDKLASWRLSFIALLPNLLLAILIIVVAIVTGRVVRRMLLHLTIRVSGKRSVASLFSTIMQIIILLTGFIIALNVLHLKQAVSSMLAGAGIIGIILGFAFQDITSNFISGIYIALKKPFDLGHTIKTNDFIGNVEQIQFRSTTIRTFSGLHLMIPNRDIIQKPLINHSLTPERRIELDIYIDHSSDLSAAHRALMNAMQKIRYACKGKAIEIYFNDIKYAAIKISIWFWIDNHAAPGYMVARHDAIYNITEALKEIDIPLVSPVQAEVETITS